jgi:hypothetical protein
MFGRKRIKELEAKNDSQFDHLMELARENEALRNQIDYLIRTIRQTDDRIFAMSQQLGWDNMRPIFAQLKDEMTARKVAESNRIGVLVEGELHNVYNPKLLGDK